MDRRDALELVGASLPLAFLLGVGVMQFPISSKAPPEWPDEPTESAVTSYAARYWVVSAHNRVLDDQGWSRGYYESISHGCEAAFEAETSAGFVVTLATSGSSSVRKSPLHSPLVSNGSMGPRTLLVSEAEVVETRLDHDDFEQDWDPPFSTRGITVVNFSPEKHRVDMIIRRADASGEPVFSEVFNLDAEWGETALEILDEPGEYEVGVSISEHTRTTYEWEISDEPREPTTSPLGSTYDVALGVYVLPDGTVEIHELPEERTTASESITERI